MEFEFCDNKPCYVNEKGIKVHVFEPGAYLCNCGENKSKPIFVGFSSRNRKRKKKGA